MNATPHATTADWREAAAALSAIARAAVEAAAADPEADGGDAEARRAVLAEILHGRFGLACDAETNDDLANANLIHVLERGRRP